MLKLSTLLCMALPVVLAEYSFTQRLSEVYPIEYNWVQLPQDELHIMQQQELIPDVTQDCELALNGLRVRVRDAAYITNDNDRYVELSGGLGSLVLQAGDTVELECSNGRLYSSLHIKKAPLPKPPKLKKLYIKHL